MLYPTPKRLARAVKEAALGEGVPERRLRRWIAASALAEALAIAHQAGAFPPYLLKGGFTIELRFRGLARASRDVDLVVAVDRADLLDALTEALKQQWSGFTFRVKGEPELRDRSFRVQVNVLYQGKEWSTFDLDVIAGPADDIELVAAYETASLGLEPLSNVPCMSVAMQIAQKLHAVTRPDEDRPRDLIDIYLCDSRLDRDDGSLFGAVKATFAERNTAWPPPVDFRDHWPGAIDELIKKNGLETTADQVLDGVRSLILRLLGVPQKMNYRYHFIVLSGHTQIPNVMQSALPNDVAFQTFQRMTETEGWRLVDMIPYPSMSPSHAVLTILEKPLEEAASIEPDSPRLELEVTTGSLRANIYEVIGNVRNVAPETALGVTVEISGIRTRATIGTVAQEDGEREFRLQLDGEPARTMRPTSSEARVDYSDRHGRRWTQVMPLDVHEDASKRFIYEGRGLASPRRLG